MRNQNTILDQILERVRAELAAAQSACPLSELQARLADAPPVRSFKEALSGDFGVIAEIKERSPSKGPMLAKNVAAAPAAYNGSPVVRAVSVLTNRSDFGMAPQRMLEVKTAIDKPVIRKDFIFDPYQVYEARAFGADALLLMTQRLQKDQLTELLALTTELGMHALVECQSEEHVARAPDATEIFGVNSRNLLGTEADFAAAREARKKAGTKQDSTTDLSAFDLISALPGSAIKVAESGISPATILQVRELGYNAALIGTDLLLDEAGIDHALAAYESILMST